MIHKIELQSRLFHKPIQVIVSGTSKGIQVLVAGGDQSHIGAVCVVDPGGNRASHCFFGHRDDAVAEKWAAEIYRKTKTPVVVSAGIHYDRISKEEIQAVLNTTDTLLGTVLEQL